MASFNNNGRVVLVRNHELRKGHGIRSSAFLNGEKDIKGLGDNHTMLKRLEEQQI